MPAPGHKEPSPPIASEMSPSVSRGLLPAQLVAVVSRALGCDPAAVQRVDCGEQVAGGVANGFLSTVGSVTLEAVVQGRVQKVHVFVKREDPGTVELVTGLDAFSKEAAFYNILLPHLEAAWWADGGQRVTPDLGPRAYLVTKDIAVLEDLTVRGYKGLGDWVRLGLEFQSVQQVLRALARVHAASLVAERCHGVRFPDLLPDLLQENFFTRRPGAIGRRLFDVPRDIACKTILPLVFNSLSDAVPKTDDELRRLQHLLQDKFLLLDMDLARRSERVLVVTHGDAWPNNALEVRDKEGRIEHVALVDFQMARWAPPAFDIMMYLHVSTRRAFRHKHADSLIRGYYSDLAGYTEERGLDLSQILSLDDFLESVERQRGRCTAIAVAYIPVMAGNEADMKALFQDGEARTEFLLGGERRCQMMKKWFDSEGEFYRKYLQEIIEEALELPEA